jgi:3-hydroxy-9,10-secoandrosta-1,3,5(10)-triene-9,17-dione monooxygenase reductase component
MADDPPHRTAVGPGRIVAVSDDLDAAAAGSFDEARFRQVLGHFCSGVTVITGTDGGAPVGLTVQSFTSLSLDPPLVIFCPARSSTSWERMRAAGVFCVNVLDEGQEAVCRAFASRGEDKFTGIGWSPAAGTGSPVLADVLAWVDCRVEHEHDGGDHSIVVGRVVDLGLGPDGRPLLFYRGGFGRFEP